MDDLMQSQIRQSCKLAFPNGLKDLMSDISREVLRAQPKDLYKFIADYLSVLLVARENLNVATRVTDDLCASECCPELEDELREAGLSDEDVETTIEIVMEYFEKGEVKESTLLCKLINKTELKETQLPKVLAAVRQAFLKHQYNKSTNIESETNSDMDETTAAAKHTLKLYRQAAELGENYNMAAEKIQAAYRAYCVRRERDPYAPKRKKSHEKPVTAGGKAITFGRDGEKAEEQCAQTLVFDRCVSKASSLSLAGSYITLPPYKPYSANDVSDVVERDEDESENATIIEYNATESTWNEEAGRSVSADDFHGPSMIEIPMDPNEIQVLSEGYSKQGAVEGVEEVIHIHELDPKIRVYKTEEFHNMEDHVMVRETDGNRNIHRIIAQNTGIPRSSVDDSKIDEVTVEETPELSPPVENKYRSFSKLRSISFITLPKIIPIEREEEIIDEVDFEENEKVLDVHEVEIGKRSAEFDEDALEDVKTNDNYSNKSNSTFSEDYSSGSSKGSIF